MILSRLILGWMVMSGIFGMAYAQNLSLPSTIESTINAQDWQQERTQIYQRHLNRVSTLREQQRKEIKFSSKNAESSASIKKRHLEERKALNATWLDERIAWRERKKLMKAAVVK